MPAALVTVTSTPPGRACAGAVATICVSETMVKSAAGVPPKLTPLAHVKPVPPWVMH